MACCLTKWRRPWTPDHTSDEDAHLDVKCSKLLTGEIYVGVDVDSNDCPEHYDIVGVYVSVERSSFGLTIICVSICICMFIYQ